MIMVVMITMIMTMMIMRTIKMNRLIIMPFISITVAIVIPTILIKFIRR